MNVNGDGTIRLNVEGLNTITSAELVSQCQKFVALSLSYEQYVVYVASLRVQVFASQQAESSYAAVAMQA